MKTPIKLFMAVCIASLCHTATAHKTSLEKLWVSKGFKMPESVVYDGANDILYVSNINGEGSDKDGNGFISRVSLDGEILEPEWISGLDAPKGMALAGNKLYVSDIDTLVEINVNDSEITNRYKARGSQFLNDVAAAGNGDIYVSDTGANTIYKLSDGSFGVWLKDDRLDSPNGLLVEQDRLLVASMGPFNSPDNARLSAVSLSSKTITNITPEPAGKLDGLETGLDGDYYVTDWPNGGLLRITTDGRVKKLLELEKGSADLEFVASTRMIIIPMMLEGELIAWKARSPD